MTEAKIKEQVGVQFLGMLAALKGYLVTQPNVDEGVDALLQAPDPYFRKSRKIRHLWGGFCIAVQMKTTTRKQVVVENGILKYDLDFDNYNDLIFRRNRRVQTQGVSMPLVLMLLVLPDEREKWVELDSEKDRFCLNGALYWFYPDESLDFTINLSSQRIAIPIANKIDLLFFKNSFNLFF